MQALCTASAAQMTGTQTWTGWSRSFRAQIPPKMVTIVNPCNPTGDFRGFSLLLISLHSLQGLPGPLLSGMTALCLQAS